MNTLMTRVPIEERFWRFVAPGTPDECWEWSGAISTTGYARIGSAGGGNEYAHRVSYEIHAGPIPAGLVIDHLCRNRSCVNPHHLEAVTTAENLRRSPLTRHALRFATACLYGHPWSAENTYTSPDGRWRSCRACRRAKAAGRRGAPT